MDAGKNTIFVLFLTLSFLSLSSCSNISKKKSSKENKASLYYSHGTENLVKKNYTQALKLLLQANELIPNDTKTLNNLGMCYFFKNKIGTAISFLKKSIESDPKNSDARNNLASIYFREGKLNEAEYQYNLVKNDLVYPHQYRTFYNLALISEKKGNLPKAKELLQLSVKERQNYCAGHFKLGEIHYKEKKYSSALKNLKSASRGTCYNYAAPVFYQGLVWLKLQDDEKALGKFKEIVNTFSKSKYLDAAQKNILELRKNNPSIALKDDLIPDLDKKIKSLEF